MSTATCCLRDDTTDLVLQDSTIALEARTRADDDRAQRKGPRSAFVDGFLVGKGSVPTTSRNGVLLPDVRRRA